MVVKAVIVEERSIDSLKKSNGITLKGILKESKLSDDPIGKVDGCAKKTKYSYPHPGRKSHSDCAKYPLRDNLANTLGG